MSKFSDKLKEDELPTPEDWEEHLVEVHSKDPGMSPDAFANMKTVFGKNSYATLVETLPSGSAHVLDLACGDGFLAPYIFERVGPKGLYTGIDMSAEELSRAKSRIADSRVTFVQGRAQQLPFPDQSFDHVLCHMAFMLMSPLEPVIAELKRVLKPGGLFAAVIAGPASDDFMLELRRMSVMYVNERFPGWPEARLGDPRLGSLDGLRELFSDDFQTPSELTDLHTEIDTNPEGAWDLMRNMYYVGLLNPKDKEELRQMILNFAHRHARMGRHLHFEFPMRIFSVRRSDS